jgi:hypothetical protein
MAATLQDYVNECRLLLHDANANFYTNPELISQINAARERVVRDTGCLRTLQVTQVPAPPPPSGNPNPVPWTANTLETIGTFVFSNIFTYRVSQTGTSGATAPVYPTATAQIPPSTPFADGTAMLQFVQNVEILPYAVLPNSLSTIDVLAINVYWGNSRIPLRYLPWREFNAQLRYWQNYIGRPVCFSVYGQSTLYLAPVPDQVYPMELDTVILPQPLVSLADVDVINDPFTTAVGYYACHKAKFKEQSFGESDIFYQKYKDQIQAIQVAIMTGRIPNPYAQM